MRRLLAGLIAGLMLGATGVAGAATAVGYWTQGGTSYSCSGVSSGVICKEKYGRYKISITPTFVGISYGAKAYLGCERGYDRPATACFADPSIP